MKFMDGNRMNGIVFGITLFAATASVACAQDGRRFSSPQAAAAALRAAVEAGDTNTVRAIFGPSAHGLVSADLVQAAEEREAFHRRLKQKITLVTNSQDQVALNLGNDAWPFPIPLVMQNGQWVFDIQAGREEVMNRRIGANELGAIGVCRAYVQAQREYASQDRDGSEVLAYAQHLYSTPGTHDGLYWSARDGGGISPLGPLVAQARVEGYRHELKAFSDLHAPYHGYYFKILTCQGKHAPGGAYNYLINGRMIAGFALVAWPAEWNNTGIMTFIVNQQGKVYEKNLGPKTGKLAGKMRAYDPDPSWKPAKNAF